ncbi:MAG TPA: hypothetical protein PKY82_02025 [Pyrinomonadaceae bacterium]|nr:hypothetical protein [Pyrinomonadaceae bacterium]
MTLVTVQNLRDWFDLAAEIKEARLTYCLDSAELTLREWVGDQSFDEADANDSTAKAKTFRLILGKLAIAELLLNTNIRIRRSGLVKTEKDDISNNKQNEYLAPSEMLNLRNQYFAEAEIKAKPFLLASEVREEIDTESRNVTVELVF